MNTTSPADHDPAIEGCLERTRLEEITLELADNASIEC